MLCDRCERRSTFLHAKDPQGARGRLDLPRLQGNEEGTLLCSNARGSLQNSSSTGVRRREQDVMWKDAEKKSGRKIYHVLYAPGDELWHDLDAQELEEEILPIDEVATKEQREKDPLLPHSEKRMVGARVVIFSTRRLAKNEATTWPCQQCACRAHRYGLASHRVRRRRSALVQSK